MKQQVFDAMPDINRKAKVLIVDDMTDNIEIAASVLAPEGFILLYAQSGSECITIAEKEQPDIILLDIMMPEMDGIETCKVLKENVTTAHIAVIFLTAKIDDETLSNSFAVGGVDYIAKPFSSSALLSRVYNQLRLIYKHEALSLAQEKLARSEKNQFLGLLAGGIAHDFNNQLNGIMGFSDLIKDRTSDDKITRLADLITECGERCAVLTNNLLAFAGKGKYQIININIKELIREAEENIKKKFPHIRVVFNSSIESPTVNGDYNQIDSVVQTVATNAAEAMMNQDNGVLVFEVNDWDGKRASCVQESKRLEYNNYLEIKVSDTGVGISEANLGKVFEPFFTTKDLSSGGGMSLAAAYGIVENHGGEISVESVEGQGTTVSILLPKDYDSEYDSRRDIELLGRDASEDEFILVVDDNKMSRIFLEDVITAQSHRVVAASSGSEGVDIYAKYKDRIRMVFLDYIMPNMTGKEALEKILQINPEAVVYMVSGYKSEQSIQELLKIGAKGFIKKPCKCEEILEVL